MIQDCQQLALDNNWALDRLNACHIGNTNFETGNIYDLIGEMKQEQLIATQEQKLAFQDMAHQIKNVSFKQNCVFGIFGAMSLCVFGILIKRYLFNK